MRGPLGLYTCAGTQTCKGRPGRSVCTSATRRRLVGRRSGQDGPLQHATQRDRPRGLGRMSRALNATGRPILFAVPMGRGAGVGVGRRGGADVPRADGPPAALVVAGKATGVGLGQGTLQIIEFMRPVPSRWVRRYGWLDPDFLMTLYPVHLRPAPHRPVHRLPPATRRPPPPTAHRPLPPWQLTMDATASRPSSPSGRSGVAAARRDRRAQDERRDAIVLLNEEVLAISQDASATAADRLRNESSGAQLARRSPTATGRSRSSTPGGSSRTPARRAAWRRPAGAGAAAGRGRRGGGRRST